MVELLGAEVPRELSQEVVHVLDDGQEPPKTPQKKKLKRKKSDESESGAAPSFFNRKLLDEMLKRGELSPSEY